MWRQAVLTMLCMCGGGGGPVNLVLSFKAHCWAVTYVVVAVVGEVLVIVSTATDYTIKMSKSYS